MYADADVVAPRMFGAMYADTGDVAPRRLSRIVPNDWRDVC